MKADEIRTKYLDFMKAHGHTEIAAAPLVLTDDPTTLFTSSGMQPLMPYLLGQDHPSGEKLVDSQPCLRTQDIDDVGDNRHTTCFEMLGNWSLGAYFKREQTEMFFEFLTKEIGLDPEKLYVTCFIGDKEQGISRDDEMAQIWQEVFSGAGIEAKIAEIGTAEAGAKRGIRPGERIFFYDDQENWWSRGGGIATTPIGDPCGPDSEVFYDYGEEIHDEKQFGKAHPASDSGRFVEIGNQVFMQYKRLEDGSFEPLKKQNVDFGGGLERIAAAALGMPDVFRTSLYRPVIEWLTEISGAKYEDHPVDFQVIADHLKGAVWLVAQGLQPSNKEQGYVLRRLIRRAILKAFNLGIEQDFLAQVVPVFLQIYDDQIDLSDLAPDGVIAVLEREEKAFRQTLRKGIRQLEKLAGDGLTGQEIFQLHDTFGFPKELSVEEAKKRGIGVSPKWEAEFAGEMVNQRARSQTAARGSFKGGLEGDGEIQKQYHTATHLLGAALDQVLGVHVTQQGSHINDERLRLDFGYPEKVAAEQLQQVEDLVNQKIAEDLPVSFAEYDTDYALDVLHATGEFREKYADKVSVYVIGEPKQPFSVDVCGGPHVQRTGELGHFKILKEQSSSAGVRRIKATLN